MANSGGGSPNANRTLIIPRGVLDPDQMNIIDIPRNQNTAVPLLVIPRRDGQGLSTRPLPVWDDELSGGEGPSGIQHLVGLPRPCSSSQSQNRTTEQANESSTLSSLYDSSGEMDEREANMFQNIMDGRYNVIRSMPLTPESCGPRLPQYWDGEGFRPRFLSTPIPESTQHHMNDTAFPSTMDSQEWFTADWAALNTTVESPLPSQCQTFPPRPKLNRIDVTQDGGSHAGRFPLREQGRRVNANATFMQPMAGQGAANSTFAQPMTGQGQANSTSAQPNSVCSRTNTTCGSYSSNQNYSDAPFGIPIDARFEDNYGLPYYPPPELIVTHPQPTMGHATPLGASLDGYGAPRIPQQSCPASNSCQNYSDAPFGLPIDTRFTDDYLPYHTPPKSTASYPQPTMRHATPLGASLDGYGAPRIPQQSYSSSNSCQNYSDAPFGIPIDTRFTDDYLPYHTPPKAAASYPQPTRRRRPVGASCGARPRSAQSSRTSESRQNYSAAPSGTPNNTRSRRPNLPYNVPPEMNASYPQAAVRRANVGASLNGNGAPTKSMCTNDDERFPRIMHMTSSSYTQVNDSPVESASFTVDAPGGVSAEVMGNILRETSQNNEQSSYESTVEESSLVIPFPYHQPPGFHDLRRAEGMNALNECTNAQCSYKTNNSLMANKTY